MVQQNIRELYQELLDSEFRFMSRGKHRVDGIYRVVKTRYPELCEDDYLCRDNCSQGHNRPEWEHTVRKVLDRLKKSPNSPVSKGETNYWIFN